LFKEKIKQGYLYCLGNRCYQRSFRISDRSGNRWGAAQRQLVLVLLLELVRLNEPDFERLFQHHEVHDMIRLFFVV
jgi:hypothetical protein